MSRRSGWAGRILAGGLAATLSVSLLMPGIASATPEEAPAIQVSDESSFTTDLFTSLAKGAAGNVGGAAAGWAMSAMGLSNGDAAALASINNDLQTIINQLAGIQQELSDINKAIDQLDCDTQSQAAKKLVTPIQTAVLEYKGFADQAAGKYGPASVPPLDKMNDWAATVTDPTNGVRPALLAINTALTNAGSAKGIIAVCLDPNVLPPPAAGTVGDTDYYVSNPEGTPTVANLIDFWFTYQAQGLWMLQEAYHYQAQQATGQTLQPDQVGDVCTNATGSLAQYACTQAIEDTNTTYESLAQQFLSAGLPYTDDQVLTLNTGDANAKLFPRSLEEFTAAAGDSCPSPLTAAQLCGVTVATGATVTDAMKVEFNGYSPWTAATKGQFQNILAKRGSTSPGAYMNSLGFKNAEHKVLLTPQTASFQIKVSGMDTFKGTATCFLYTQLEVLCGDSYSGQIKETLLEPYRRSKAPFPCPTYPFWRTNGSLPGNVPFFAANLLNKSETFSCKYYWSEKPGWVKGNTSSSAKQLRWPQLNVADLTCTNGRSPTNPGGVPTRCGDDFDAMFNTLVTRPVTCSGSTFGTCNSDGPTVKKLKAKKVKKHRATVVWKQPKGSGPGEISKYQTRIKGPGKAKANDRNARSGRWSKWRTTDSAPGDRRLKHVHRKLKAGKVYRVQVRAVSAVGSGKAKKVKFRTDRAGIPVRPGNG